MSDKQAFVRSTAALFVATHVDRPDADKAIAWAEALWVKLSVRGYGDKERAERRPAKEVIHPAPAPTGSVRQDATVVNRVAPLEAPPSSTAVRAEIMAEMAHARRMNEIDKSGWWDKEITRLTARLNDLGPH